MDATHCLLNIHPNGRSLQRSADGGTSWTNITPSGISANVCDLEISSTAVAARLHLVVGIGTPQAYRYTDIPSTVSSGSYLGDIIATASWKLGSSTIL